MFQVTFHKYKAERSHKMSGLGDAVAEAAKEKSLLATVLAGSSSEREPGHQGVGGLAGPSGEIAMADSVNC